MKGKYHIIIRNNRVHYEFDIRRNLTIIRGDSGSGKTTLIHMVELLTTRGSSSGIEISCSKNCRTLPIADWQIILPLLHDQIIFLDEDSEFIKREEFARAVRSSDNYFVIVTREDLPNLPYSVDEIYGIHASGKYHDLKRTYNEFYRIYEAPVPAGKSLRPDVIVTEDSNSGFGFFQFVGKKHGVKCSSSNGKSNLRRELSNAKGKSVVGIADGAAIGPEMNELCQLMLRNRNIHLYLPESFEWLLLKSGLIDGNYVKEVLEHPEDYIDSTECFSWEQFFTKLLIEQTSGTYLQYRKASLNTAYLQDREMQAVLSQIQALDFGRDSEQDLKRESGQAFEQDSEKDLKQDSEKDSEPVKC